MQHKVIPDFRIPGLVFRVSDIPGFRTTPFKKRKQRLMNMAHNKTFFKSQRPVRDLCILVFFLEMT